jgi:prepilin peptidase CpaA
MLLLMGWAAVIDWRERRIPNWINGLLIAGGLVQSCFALHTVTPGQSVLGLLVGAALPFALFVLGAAGAGDVKLMAGAGAWLGPQGALALYVIEKILGLLIVVTQAAWQGRTRVLLRNSAVVAVNLLYVREVGVEHASQTGRSCRSVDRPLPFAVPALAAAVLVVLHLASGG